MVITITLIITITILLLLIITIIIIIVIVIIIIIIIITNNNIDVNDDVSKNQVIWLKKWFLRLCLKVFKLLVFFMSLGFDSKTKDQ